ncbi:MAG: preprotein translocase subunit SecG [Candidatus Cloacimonadales bacterium]|jgi:preprotein translocase subunit SecG|nr:preprotein translocase subunit SecG [Candidatus Cloacimonadota bacterium]MDX9976424.1 preprotein translocase subunit SecG [Candidatus Cloacimonadales bacterium]
MWTFLIIIHVLICLALILVVLMQTGKGGLDSSFAGIASNTFGTQGASDVIKNATKILFGVFIISCVLLATVNPNKQKKTLTERDKRSQTTTETSKPVTDQPIAPLEQQPITE